MPAESQRDKSDPVTLEHLHCLLRNLDLSSTKDTAIYAVSTAAFHGVCRSSELCILSCNLFNPSKHVSNTTHINFDSTPSGVRHASFNIPWSKTKGSKGATIILTDLNDPTSPIPALHHHLSANTKVPPGAPLLLSKLMMAAGNLSPKPIG